MIIIQKRLLDRLRQGGSGAVCESLKDALRLELSTIPLYLYSLYSLDLAKNRDIGAILRGVCIEEMLHMALVCNIINALGDAPDIDDPTFAPTYPGPLPGGVESDLTVNLAPFSYEQLDAFLKIESPEIPLKFPTALADAKKPVTIGQFYAELKRQIELLGNGAFSTQPRNQVASDIIDNAIVVTNVDGAKQAIDLIVQQGEGTATSPGEVAGTDYAHYYHFNQIAEKHRLMKNDNAPPDAPPDQRYIYNGPAIVFDPTGVRAVPINPKAKDYAAGSDARRAIDAFNQDYTALLKSLQEGFSGNLDKLDMAVNTQMPALGGKARALVKMPAPNGGGLGPSFEYFG